MYDYFSLNIIPKLFTVTYTEGVSIEMRKKELGGFSYISVVLY